MKKKIRVNGQIIPEEAVQFEFERLVRFYTEHGWSQEQIKGNLPELVEQAQQQAVGAKLLLDEAARLDIPVSEAEVDKQIEGVVEQVGGHDAFVRALEAQQTSETRFREQMRQGKRVDKLVAQATAGVDEPTENDIENYFAEHQAEFTKGDRVLAQHILITPDGDSDHARQEARGKINAILERVRGGASFGDEAAAHSMCPSGQEGGSLGWFGRGMMVPEFDKAVFTMNVGDVSDVIETPFGYHIILKTDHETGGDVSFDDVREQIRDLIRHARRGAAMTSYVEELKAKAQIEIEAC
ncbi:MAG: peptidylprolyl isomerase [Kiritimatiellaeota bacterium]|nr:peptidylprolyl isomerase [Kiritimatiellota bacterium]